MFSKHTVVALAAVAIAQAASLSSHEAQADPQDWDGNIVYYIGGGPVDWQPKSVTESRDELKKQVLAAYPNAFFDYKHQSSSGGICSTIKKMRLPKQQPQGRRGRFGWTISRAPVAGKTILVGHSYGASSSTTIARCLQKEGITVDLQVTMDMVHRPFDRKPDVIPDNVTETLNFYQTDDAFLRGLQNARREDGSHSGITNTHVEGDLGSAPHFGVIVEIMLKANKVEDAVLNALK